MIIHLMRKIISDVILLNIQKLMLINVILVANAFHENAALIFTSNLFTLKSRMLNVKFVIKFSLYLVIYLNISKLFVIRFELFFTEYDKTFTQKWVLTNQIRTHRKEKWEKGKQKSEKGISPT